MSIGKEGKMKKKSPYKNGQTFGRPRMYEKAMQGFMGIRMPEETKRKVMELGGCAWLLELIKEALKKRV